MKPLKPPIKDKEDVYSLDEEKIECALGNRDIWFLAGQESLECSEFYLCFT